MEPTATLYTGVKSKSPLDYYLFVYRRRVYEKHEVIDSIELDLGSEGDMPDFVYRSNDIIENMNRDTKVIDESVWQEYCKHFLNNLEVNGIFLKDI